jgi:hypothetical protein
MQTHTEHYTDKREAVLMPTYKPEDLFVGLYQLLKTPQEMFEVYENYQQMFSMFDFLSKRGFVLDVKEFGNEPPDPNYIHTGGKLLKYFFSLHSDRIIADDQANEFAPIFYVQIFSHLPDDDINGTDIKDLLQKDNSFWELIKTMFDYSTLLTPLLKQELEKLHDQHPELADKNKIQLRDLQALIFAYKPYTEKELEPLFKICREKETAPTKYFELVYSAVKAAKQSIEPKETKPQKEELPRSKQQTFTQIQENGLDKQELIKKASFIPSSSIVEFIYRVLTVGKSGLGELPERLEKQSLGKKKVTISRKGQIREIKQTTPKGQDIIIIETDNLLEKRSNSSARKIFLYFLRQILQQALSNANVIRDGVTINYQDVIGKKMYRTTQTAKRGLERAFDLLSTIKVKGYISRGKGRIEQVKASVLFYDLDTSKKGIATLKINDTLNWGYIIQQYSIMPDAYYELPPNAADLYYYIFNQARINIKKLIENNGKINISYKSIHTFLGLTSIESATNPTVQIKNPIENAIGDILDCDQDELYIEVASPTEYNNINEYLERGYITAVINPECIEPYKEKFKEWEKAIQKEQERQQKIIDTAKEKALQKKLETKETST